MKSEAREKNITDLPSIDWEGGLKAILEAVRLERRRKQSKAMHSTAFCGAPKFVQTEAFVRLADDAAKSLGISQDQAELALSTIWAVAAFALAPDQIEKPGSFLVFADDAIKQLHGDWADKERQKPTQDRHDDGKPFFDNDFDDDIPI